MVTNLLLIVSFIFTLVSLPSLFFQDVVPKYPTTCDVEWVDAEDPLFLLYTSGSTGKPKVFKLPWIVNTYLFATLSSVLI